MASALLSSTPTLPRTDPSLVLLTRGGRSNSRKSNLCLPSRRRNLTEALHHRRRVRTPLLRSIRSSSSPGLDDDPGGDPAPDVDGDVKDWGVEAALSMLRFYKREISPLLPSSCRYLPTCSEYSMESYKKYGVAKGTVLTAWRLCRCNPLGGSGFDPPRWFNEKSQTEQ